MHADDGRKSAEMPRRKSILPKDSEAQKRPEEHPHNKRVWHGMPCCQHTVKAAPRTTAMKMKAEG